MDRLRVVRAVVGLVALLCVPAALAQADAWEGHVGTVLGDIAAVRATAETAASDVASVKASVAAQGVRVEAMHAILIGIAFWQIAMVGYHLWADFHLGGKFHLGERRGD